MKYVCLQKSLNSIIEIEEDLALRGKKTHPMPHELKKAQYKNIQKTLLV